MGDISNALVSAIIAGAQAENLKDNKTITVQATIKKIENQAIGSYTVDYLGNSFLVYANNVNVNYSVNDEVYLLIPDGNFEKDKFIIGFAGKSLVKATDAAVDNIETEEDKFFDICENYFDITQNISDDGVPYQVRLNSYNSQNVDIAINNDDICNILINENFKTYKYFKLSCKIFTNLPINQRVGGNYGLKLVIPTIVDGQNFTKEIVLDKTNLLGDIYNFNNYTEQRIYFSLDNEKISINTEEPILLSAFVEDFYQEEKEDDYFDIFIKDISLLSCLEITTEDKVGTKLFLTAEQGPLFLDNSFSNIKKITTELRVNNKKTDITQYECYWFEEDASVTRNSEYYLTCGGQGWRCINQYNMVSTNDESEPKKQYLTNNYYLNVAPYSDTPVSDVSNYVFKESRFKCVINYGGTPISAIIKITNLNNSLIEITLEGDQTSLPRWNSQQIVYEELKASICDPANIITEKLKSVEFFWARAYSNGQYDDLGSGTNIQGISGNTFFSTIVDANSYDENNRVKYSRIRIGNNKVEDFNIIYCTIYYTRSDGSKVNLGTKSLVVRTIEGRVYILQMDNGIRNFKYDTNGNSPLVAEYAGEFPNRTIKPLTFSLFHADDNTVFTSNEYKACTVTWMIPKKDTLLVDINDTSSRTEDENFYIYSQSGLDNYSLYYSIANEYNSSYTNNTVFVYVKYCGVLLTDKSDFSFVKEGEDGTNGTLYSAQILFENGTDEGGNPLWWTYGEENEKGINKDLKIISHPLSTEKGNQNYKWVYVWGDPLYSEYDTAYNYKILGADNSSFPRFKVRVYKNGEICYDSLSETEGYSVTWTWLGEGDEIPEVFRNFNFWDSVNQIEKTNFTGNICQICSCSIDKMKEGLFDSNHNPIKDTSWTTDIYTRSYNEELHDYTYTQTEYVNILQANIYIESENKYIYVRYPIEIARTNHTLEEEFDYGKYELLENIPSIGEGFGKVTYDFDATRPSYENKTFKARDGIKKEDAEITRVHTWSASYNFDVNEFDINEREIKIVPKAKWNNSNFDNYIKLHSDPAPDHGYTETFGKLMDHDCLAQIYDPEDGKCLQDLNAKKNIFTEYPWADEQSIIHQGILYEYENLSFITVLGTKDVEKVFTYRSQITQLEEKFLTYLEVFGQYAEKIRNIYDSTGQILPSPGSLISAYHTQINILNEQGLIPLNKNYISNLSIGVFEEFIQDYLDFFATEQIRTNDIVIIKNYQKQIDSALDKLNKKITALHNLANIDFNEAKDALDRLIIVISNLKNKVTELLTTETIEITPRMDDPLGYVDKEDHKINYSFKFLWNGDCGWQYMLDKLVEYESMLNSTNITLSDIQNKVIQPCRDMFAAWDKTSTAGVKDISDRFKENWYNWSVNKINQEFEVNTEGMNYQQWAAWKCFFSYDVVRPIVFLTDTYGFEALNQWDGTSIKLDEDNGAIMSPQMGAGQKEEDNTFTGVVMGVQKPKARDKQDIGLFGLSKGRRSFFLDAKKGSAVFGFAGKGQILFEPGAGEEGDAALIKGGLYDEGEGMLIDLAKPEIKWANNKFSVNEKGILHAIDGIFEGEIIANSGSIGGLNIRDNYLSYNQTSLLGDKSGKDGVYLGPDGLGLGNGKVYINKKGAAYFADAIQMDISNVRNKSLSKPLSVLELKAEGTKDAGLLIGRGLQEEYNNILSWADDDGEEVEDTKYPIWLECSTKIKRSHALSTMGHQDANRSGIILKGQTPIEGQFWRVTKMDKDSTGKDWSADGKAKRRNSTYGQKLSFMFEDYNISPGDDRVIGPNDTRVASHIINLRPSFCPKTSFAHQAENNVDADAHYNKLIWSTKNGSTWSNPILTIDTSNGGEMKGHEDAYASAVPFIELYLTEDGQQHVNILGHGFDKI